MQVPVDAGQGLRRRVEPRDRVQDQVEPQRGQLRPAEHRRAPLLDHVGDGGPGRPPADLAQLVERPRGLDERGVGPGLARRLGPRQRLVHPDRGQRVGARDDEEVAAAPGVDRGPDLLEPGLPVDDLLARHVAAPLRPHLVFEEAPGRPGVDERAHGADHVQGIAVAGVGVDEDGDVHRAADVAGPLDDLGLGEEAEIGLADERGGDGVAGDEGEREAGPLGDLRRQRVVDAGEDEGAPLVEDPPHAVGAGIGVSDGG